MLKIANVDEPKTKKRIPKPHNGNDSSKYKVYTYDFAIEKKTQGVVNTCTTYLLFRMCIRGTIFCFIIVP